MSRATALGTGLQTKPYTPSRSERKDIGVYAGSLRYCTTHRTIAVSLVLSWWETLPVSRCYWRIV